MPTQAKFARYNNKHVGADFYYTPNRMFYETRSLFLIAYNYLRARGNHHIWATLSFIQHKISHDIECSPKVDVLVD